MVIRAGDEVGCGVVDELNLAAPLVLPAAGSVAIQVVVGGPDKTGVRAVSVFSRGETGSGWLLHAEGALSAGSVPPASDLSVWPPAGAVAVDIGDGYERLAERGYGYGPAFRGLSAMWWRGDEMFAEVALPEEAGVSAAGFGVHPVVLDAALHAVVLASKDTDAEAQGSAWCRSPGKACRCMPRAHRRYGHGSCGRPRRPCRSSWPTGWGCRSCRWRPWWPAR